MAITAIKIHILYVHMLPTQTASHMLARVSNYDQRTVSGPQGPKTKRHPKIKKLKINTSVKLRLMTLRAHDCSTPSERITHWFWHLCAQWWLKPALCAGRDDSGDRIVPIPTHSSITLFMNISVIIHAHSLATVTWGKRTEHDLLSFTG